MPQTEVDRCDEIEEDELLIKRCEDQNNTAFDHNFIQIIHSKQIHVPSFSIGALVSCTVYTILIVMIYSFVSIHDKNGEFNNDKLPSMNPVSESESRYEPFEFISGEPGGKYDEAYKLAFSEMSSNIVKGTFIAGVGWAQLWTRDTAYAIELAAGLLHPIISEISLRSSTEQDEEFGTVWLQDSCGHFGGWPHLTDAIVGAQGAWSLYVITGNKGFLSWAYDITLRSLDRAERDAFDNSTGLFFGCSSFMESNSGYPSKYKSNGTLVGKTKALSTNLLYYNGYKLGAMMGKELLADKSQIDGLLEKAKVLRTLIRDKFWLSKEGYYSYFQDENNELVTQMEGLGESLVLISLDFEDDPKRIDSIFNNTHRTKLGIPCLWPQFIHEKVKKGFAMQYHNGRIWPFVQGYWAYAAAKHGKVDIFSEEFRHLLQLSQKNQTFAEFYELDGTFPIQRRRQLWSDTGYLSMVYHGLFGMNFTPDGITFSPIKPKIFANDTMLRNMKYREMILHICVKGTGSQVKSFELDGKVQNQNFVASNMKGTHHIVITLSN